MPSNTHAVQVHDDAPSGLADARRITDALFDIVKPDSLYERPIPERHRIIFYIGHLEAFDRNLLNGRLLSLPDSYPDLDRLFAFGIDPVGGALPTDQPTDWPAIERVRQYVQQVRGELDEGLENRPQQNGEFSADLLVSVAVEHRLMHAETLAYMLHRLPHDRKIAPTGVPQVVVASVRPSLVEIPAGSATLGLARASHAFGWDNEYEQHSVDVPSFAIDRYKTTNAEYLEFIEDGGYENRACWNESDWAWKESNRISHPAFWDRQGNRDDWFWKGMFADIPLPLDWPVYVSHAEASAYANSAGKRLPTEAQWQRAAYGSPGAHSRMYPWGSKSPDATRGNFDFANWDPTSVAAHPAGISAFGVDDILGNGWEWTSTVFAPFAGFQPFPFYAGYSADFFDGKHYVIKGASSRTAACMLRPSFRNWFQPHYQYVYAGFRCVSNRLA